MVPNDPNLNLIAPNLCEKYLIYSRNAQFYYANYDHCFIYVIYVESCRTKVLYVHFIDYHYFMLIVDIIVFMCIMNQ